MTEWIKVVEAGDCESLDEDREILICHQCEGKYSDCPCPGPHQEDVYEYMEQDGQLYGRRKE